MDVSKAKNSSNTKSRVFADALGSFLFVFLLLIRMAQAWQGSAVALLLALQSALVAFRLVIRKDERQGSPWQIKVIAWVSAMLPLTAMVTGSAGAVFMVPGLFLSIWALVALGGSLSISPSDRGLVQSGPYRLIRHPMYAGELLALFGLCFANPMLWNWVILAVFGVSIYMRIVEEESILDGYHKYQQRVTWRLVPWLW